MKNVVFAVINPAAGQEELNKLREFTISWSRYGYHGDLIEAATIDHALVRAAQTPAAYCLLQGIGHVIDEQWYLSHWQKEGFYRGMRRLMDKGDFLVAGEWFGSESACLGLQTDCLLVNLDQYRKLGLPRFGEADFQVRQLPTTTLPPEEDLTSSHTGLHDVMTNVAGWHFIATSLQHHLPVRRFGNAINNCRFNLAGDVQTSEFHKLVGQPINKLEQLDRLLPAQRTFISRIQKQLADAKRGVFLFNIESYDDLQNGAVNRPPLDAVFSVAAGFKPYKILQTQGFHADTKVILFDYSLKALEVRRYIVEHWDGVDFPRFIRRIFTEFPHPEAFYQLWHDTTPDNIDWHDVDMLWQQELDKWGGAQNFQQHWQACRKLPHQYLHCDLLQGRQELLDALSLYQNAYIWWSNAFFTIYSHWHYSADERKQQYLAWVEELAKAAPDCQVNGADHHNVAVNGLTAAAYEKQFVRHPEDELAPQRLHTVDIRF
ncbi:hypothetical protein [Undibacterium sp. TS12]|uniref:hypothetical protein n=1 Tax=Undibacterium sp. TS12 TaxID=2908202 RepID=UPI001F4CD95F|nr:hypothetical protein [Undibacterium sp. TS12]MCH8622527.1 hypothetical protein [Undibacterium sp. TS12]